MNNIPEGKTEDEIAEFLEKHTKQDKDKLKIVMTESGRENITVRVTSGIEIDNILSTVEKIDFRVTRETNLRTSNQRVGSHQTREEGRNRESKENP